MKNESSHYSSKYWNVDLDGYPTSFIVPILKRFSITRVPKEKKTSITNDIEDKNYVYTLGSMKEAVNKFKDTYADEFIALMRRCAIETKKLSILHSEFILFDFPTIDDLQYCDKYKLKSNGLLFFFLFFVYSLIFILCMSNSIDFFRNCLSCVGH